MWTYQQSTGFLTDKDGVVVAKAYSGHGEGKNNPAMQNVKNVGPIPRGRYKFVGPPTTGPGPHGPYVIRIMPEPDNEMYGRAGFLLHGDSREHPGGASEGCIIAGRAQRGMVWQSGDRDLNVIA